MHKGLDDAVVIDQRVGKEAVVGFTRLLQVSDGQLVKVEYIAAEDGIEVQPVIEHLDLCDTGEILGDGRADAHGAYSFWQMVSRWLEQPSSSRFSQNAR